MEEELHNVVMEEEVYSLIQSPKQRDKIMKWKTIE